MIINKIILKNFKSHKDSTINLYNGISLIIGSNGAGKSTILEAISYALFKEFNGTISEVIRKRTDDTDIIKEMKVIVYFNHNGKEYRLTRGKRGTQNIAELREIKEDNSGILIKGDTVVTKEIEQIIGVDKTSYLNAVYIKQGEITALIDKSAGERKALIAKLLNIDNLQKSWENMKDLIQQYQIEQEVNEKLLSNKENEEEEKREIEENIKKYEEEVEEEKNTIQNKQKANEDKAIELELLRKKENKYIEYTSHINNINSNIQNEENNKISIEKNLKSIEELEEENKEYEKKIKPLDYMEELMHKKQEYENNKYQLRNIIENIEKINSQKDIIKNTEDNYNKYNENIVALDGYRKEKEDITKQKQSLDLKNEQLKENNNKKEENFINIRNIVSDAQKILEKNLNNADEVKNEINEQLNKYQKEKEEINKKIHENNAKISSHKTTINSTQKSLRELEKTENTCPICQSEISEDKHQELSRKYHQNIEDNEKGIQQLNDENKKHMQEIDTLDVKIDNINTIPVEELTTTYAKFKDLSTTIKNLKKELEDYDSIQEEFEKTSSQLDNLEKNIKDLTEDYEKYKTATRILKDYDEELLNKQRSDIESKQDELKNMMISLQSKFRPVDNLEQEIKYLNDIKSKVEKNKGILSTKESVVENLKRSHDNLTRWNNQLDNTKRELQELGFDEEYYKKINEEYTSSTKELESIKEDHAKKENDLKHLKNRINELENKLKEYTKITKKQENIKDYIKLLVEIRELYSKDGVQGDLRHQAKPRIESKTKEIFDAFGFGYKDVKLDDEYNMTIYNNDNEVIPLELLSGGEKIIIALSLRLAIAKVIEDTKTDLLILDEPTIHLDEDRRGQLVEILSEANIAPQMIVITHDSELLGISNNIITISKDNGISTVSSNN